MPSLFEMQAITLATKSDSDAENSALDRLKKRCIVLPWCCIHVIGVLNDNMLPVFTDEYSFGGG